MPHKFYVWITIPSFCNRFFRPYIPDLQKKKPQPSHDNYPLGPRLGGWGKLIGWLACSSIRLPGQQGLCRCGECSVFRVRDEGLQEIWHDILAGPDCSPPPFCCSLPHFYLLDTFSPAVRPHPCLCSLSDIIITIRLGTSDIWPLSVWEEGVDGGRSQAAVQGL